MFLTLNRSALQLNKRSLVWRMFFTLNRSTLQLNKR
jgi:hypothetical protein